MRKILVSILLLLSALTLPAQSPQLGWETLYAQLLEQDDEAGQSDEETYELLSELAEHPIVLNQATREDLERIPFLSETQIEELIAYITQYHGMRTMGELSLIESLDGLRRALLPYFLLLTDDETTHFPSLHTILQRGRHTVVGQVGVPFYDRQGDHEGFLGPKYRHSIRYTFQYGPYITAGLTAAQDAGEPFFAGGNRWGYDHYSYYAVARKMTRHLKTIAVGRYRVRMGLGLVANNDVAFGKMMTLPSLFRTGSTIRGHASRSSYNYLQGAAAEIALSKHFVLSAFLSWRTIDATLTKDGRGIATLLQTGYHRTTSEMNRKDNASQTASGGHIAWRHGGFHLGATGVWTRFDKPLQPNTSQAFRRFYPAGEAFWNASIDYGYTSHRLSLSGETATGGCRALATLHALSFRLYPTLTLTAVQRYYSYKYQAVMGQSFADGGRVQNESGVMAKVDWALGSFWTLTAYTDFAYFPWAKYQVVPQLGPLSADHLPPRPLDPHGTLPSPIPYERRCHESWTHRRDLTTGTTHRGLHWGPMGLPYPGRCHTQRLPTDQQWLYAHAVGDMERPQRATGHSPGRLFSYRRLRLAYLRLRAWTALRLLLSRLFWRGAPLCALPACGYGAKVDAHRQTKRDRLLRPRSHLVRTPADRPFVESRPGTSVTTQIVSQSHLCCASTVYMPSFQPGFVPRIKNGLYTLTLTRTGVTSKISL